MPATRAIARLEQLGELAVALSSAITRREVGEVIADLGRKIARADVCTIHVPGKTPGSLTLLAARGVEDAVLDAIREITPASNNPALDTMRTGQPLWVENEAEYAALFPNLFPLRTVHAFWSMPLVSEGVAIGLIGMGFREARTFADDERAFVGTFARQCAETLRRAERLEAEREAHAAAESLRASFETTLRSIGDAVITTDREGRVTLMNPVAEALSGWREADALGRPSSDVFRIVDEKTRAPLPSPVDQARQGGVTVTPEHDTLLQHASGERFTPIEDTAAPIRASTGGEVEGVVLVFRDASHRRDRDVQREFLERVSATLAESIEYEQTIAHVAQLLVPTLADWCSVEVVDEGSSVPRQIAVAHVDPTKTEVARTYAARYPPDPNAPRGVSNVLRTGKSELYPELTDAMVAASAVDAEHLALLRELRLRSVLFAPLIARGRVFGAITLVQAESGRTYSSDDLAFAEEIARRCATAIDNARLFAAELSARRAAVVANRMKDEFLAMMSHELRTPLSSIMGWSKLMMAPGADPGLATRGLDVIHRNTIAMGALIDDLLDLSRITSGKIRLDLRQVDLARIVENAVDGVRADAAAKQLQITTALARDLGPLRGDATRLGQITSNLLSNAVKFTPASGRIEVILRRVGDDAEIEVSDTGKGIDAAFLPHVFELFQQEETAQARTRGGLGLGLAISRQLAELHGGTITAASEGPGRGARFVVRIPIARPDPERASPARTSSSSQPTVSTLQGVRVLTVDDNDDARAFVKAALELRGAIVRTASSVDAALAAIDEEIPDVLLSDLGMPVRDGYSLIAELRSRPPERGGAIPAAAVSAFAYQHDRDRTLRAGFAAHLAKPVDPADLVALVQRLRARG